MTIQNIYKNRRKKNNLFFLLCAVFLVLCKEGETRKISSLEPLKAYTFSDQVLLSEGGKMVARLKFKGPKKAPETAYLIRGIYKKMDPKIDKSRTERKEIFLIIWQDVIIERENKLPQTIVLKNVYSHFYKETSLILTGTSFDVQGDLKLLFSKIQEAGKTVKTERDLKVPRSSSLGEKKRGAFSETSSVLEGGLSQEGFKPGVKKRLSQGFQEWVPHSKKYKKQKKNQEQGHGNFQGFVPETMEVEILKEGCSVRIDIFQESAIIQTRSIIRKNGKIYKEEPCSDSSERYPLKKRYEGCRDLILKEEGRAHPQYKHYWVDEKGNTQDVDHVCKPDEDITFEILEDKGACDLDVDLTHMTARQMATLYYKDYKKRRIILEGCRPLLKKETFPLEKVFCGYHHNFEEGKSIPQTRVSLFFKGQERRITPCCDDGESLFHQISTMGCDPLIDRASGKKFAQGRVMIETQDGPLFLTRCRPSQELEETGEGCSQKFDHDLEMGQSRGYTRFFYKKGGHLVYVTECEPSEKIFLHQVRQVGYVHDDGAKTSKAQTEVYIETPDAGIILVEGAKIRNETPSIAYKPEEIRECPDTENAFYEGCFKITPQNRLQVYRRPDGTVYEEIIGKGALEKSQNLCRISEETSEHKSSSWMTNVCGRPCSDVHYPAGSYDGAWLGCHEAKRRAPWGNQGVRFFLYHSSFLEKRLKTEFPSGEILVGPWERISPTQNVLTQTCQ